MLYIKNLSILYVVVLQGFLSNLVKALNTLEYNNIIRLFNNTDSNLIWSNSSNKTIAAGLSKYQRFNHIVKHGQITLKDKLYNNFLRFQKKFPDDYTYMADTYTSERINQFKKKYRNYEISKDNLWLIKPKGAARGIGIHFLKNVDEINKTDIVTKYISNPLLLEKKKFDLRVYLLVTGHDHLKIYIYKESFARMSSDEYDLELEDLDNVFKHLTNVSVNKKKKTQNGSSFIWSLPKVKRYISEEYGVDFNEVWEKIEDIAIKAVITMNKLEIDTEKKMYSHLNSSNTFELYGVDILIDDNMKPWLLEINLSPGLSSKTGYQRSLKYKLMDDTFNIVGLVPYSHITGLAMEGECEYKDPVDEAVQQSVCEITRPTVYEILKISSGERKSSFKISYFVELREFLTDVVFIVIKAIKQPPPQGSRNIEIVIHFYIVLLSVQHLHSNMHIIAGNPLSSFSQSASPNKSIFLPVTLITIFQWDELRALFMLAH
ncbi:tubulin-tyrosine ligase family-domain-containing protein [Neocallimastix lanati (nom. inval.)]|nr:tubulin-tyrosine ligase family-domain-containing protein [Neocallimastix sp. JGI-2020a]